MWNGCGSHPNGLAHGAVENAQPSRAAAKPAGFGENTMTGAIGASAVLLLAAAGLATPGHALASSHQSRPAEAMQCRTFEGPPGGVLIRYNCQPASDRSRTTGTVSSGRTAADQLARPTRSDPARR
jgi:hypothetical protein